MSYAALAGNQPISTLNLEDAVNNQIFTLKSGQSYTGGQRCKTCDEISELINVNPVSGGNKLVLKNQLISNTIINCGPSNIPVSEYGPYLYNQVINGLTYPIHRTERTVILGSTGNSTLSLGLIGEFDGDIAYKKYLITQDVTVLYDSGWVNVIDNGSTLTPTLSLTSSNLVIGMLTAFKFVG